MLTGKKSRQQAAVDFLVSYGIAILLVAISIYVVTSLGIFGNSLAQPGCATAGSFSCGAFALNANGLLTFTLTQVVSSSVNVIGVACSSGINVTGDAPEYGNVKILSYSAAPQFYPTNEFQNGLMLYGDQPATITANCYGSGGISSQNLGQPYTGYVWLNYTSAGLPGTYYTIERAMQFTTRSS
jgi:hypothetical protein